MLFGSAFAAEVNRSRIVTDCASVKACIQEMEATLPEEDTGRVYRDEESVASILKARFGRDARNALLEMAVSDHGGWRNYAGGILSHWHDWDESDVPKLNRALELDPGGSIAHALAEIGTPSAIEALMKDFSKNGIHTQTSYALKELGLKVLDHILPVLGQEYGDENNGNFRGDYFSAESLIIYFGEAALPYAEKWTAIALDDSKPEKRRIGALRGVGAIGALAKEYWVPLRQLLSSDNSGIAKQAFDTLVRMRDPYIAPKFANLCEVGKSRFHSYGNFETRQCLNTIAAFGSYGYAAGPKVLELLNNTINGAESAYAIETLGHISFSPASQSIRSHLGSDDWRVVYSSIRALAQLQDQHSVDEIAVVAMEHWLPEIRNLAAIAFTALKTEQKFIEPKSKWQKGWGPIFGDYTAPTADEINCSSNKFKWKQNEVYFNSGFLGGAQESSLDFEGGVLSGTNRGEFGGMLTYIPPSGGGTVLLHEDNVLALYKDGKDAVAIFGLSHMASSSGYALAVHKSENGDFLLREIARFPSAAYQSKSIGNGLFAVNANGRVVVFSSDGILGLATCQMAN